VAYKLSKIFASSIALFLGSTILPNAHPHVFVEANMELVINDKNYTALRAGKDVINFYEPDKLNAYMENGQMVMFFSIEPEKPHDFSKAPLKISASDTSYYVAFEFSEKNVVLKENAQSCKTKITVPNYDELYASNSDTLSEAFFSNPENPQPVYF